jgi:CO dehydrogenase nickel-insertion accessory protein CooC1
MSPGIVRHIDMLLIVVAPYYRSLEAAGGRRHWHATSAARRCMPSRTR